MVLFIVLHKMALGSKFETLPSVLVFKFFLAGGSADIALLILSFLTVKPVNSVNKNTSCQTNPVTNLVHVVMFIM